MGIKWFGNVNKGLSVGIGWIELEFYLKKGIQIWYNRRIKLEFFWKIIYKSFN